MIYEPTVAERIVICLRLRNCLSEDPMNSKTPNQDDLAVMLGKSRAHMSLELKKLRNKGLVEEYLGHDGLDKRKKYYLTGKGMESANRLYRVMESLGRHPEDVIVDMYGVRSRSDVERAKDLICEALDDLEKVGLNETTNRELYGESASRLCQAIRMITKVMSHTKGQRWNL